ncbi:hydrogenase maturation nickel metallochaperone HypA [Pseudooceanicola sp. CBS1P-1]|uniref:Hydrogenase maturation factor HypA n=1 Tax=Pseudooceanicola albus TaxID=2692189 RepID=A0A6L7G6Y6_9RHOB|nr:MULTISPECIES: hydrogenase maturation nickel metallochaperone HypA [Pseudooceanicola]MBT9384202.1 hydrogenase maturation nickel metallochaperone HypA [Pseudooceanicola endophyticus]MXN19699.1 hydrogenase maturation nickel metallochaperone HypA [Pseudooceanicola albus]
MHEMSLCEGIRRVVEQAADRPDVTRVTRVRLEIGRFAGVEKPALGFAWEVVMRGSKAEGAELVMLDLPGVALCYDCMKTVEIENRLDPCPLCGGGRLLPQGGDEMQIKDMEVI